MKAALIALACLPILLGPARPAHAQRVAAELTCAPTPTPLVYDCTVRLARGDQPLEGVEITVGADMPSMPMAHSVRPVTARPGRAPGEYETRLELEMPGEWAIRLRLGGRVRDQLILHYHFDATGARPAGHGGHRH